MEHLRTAVVDIAMLVATCQALAFGRSTSVEAVERKLRSKLRKEVELGTLAYINTLSRTKRGEVDESLLLACRTAAEQVQARALLHQPLLQHIMASESGALDGMVALRQDLWRLAHITIYLGVGLTALRQARSRVNADAAVELGARLRRRFRRALAAYTQAALQSKAKKGRLVMKARAAALAEIGPRGATLAERLADLEASADETLEVLRLGVVKPLLNLALDWQGPAAINRLSGAG